MCYLKKQPRSEWQKEIKKSAKEWAKQEVKFSVKSIIGVAIVIVKT